MAPKSTDSNEELLGILADICNILTKASSFYFCICCQLELLLYSNFAVNVAGIDTLTACRCRFKQNQNLDVAS